MLLVGLVCVRLMSANDTVNVQRRGLQVAILGLAVWFVVAGSASAWRHSRLRIWETDVPGYTKAETINPRLDDYFHGVRFTDAGRRILESVTTTLANSGLETHTKKIYWGPGLEILHRVYGGELRGRLPLWYDVGVTLRKQDFDRVAAELDKGDYEWIIAWRELPMRDYMEKRYRRTSETDLVVYRRIH